MSEANKICTPLGVLARTPGPAAPPSASRSSAIYFSYIEMLLLYSLTAVCKWRPPDRDLISELMQLCRLRPGAVRRPPRVVTADN
ncbi:hypothetical protein EVAR_28443_1 [Eumeta japonica]|uniref:Uncharacterized protein n=1 Tax=Eumeta variegata TaxID=151549 RepID=A0A4C1V7X5_EUMVA|nr:hypothetical protein EVAR_28443_1 [Eumeta japonica]